MNYSPDRSFLDIPSFLTALLCSMVPVLMSCFLFLRILLMVIANNPSSVFSELIFGLITLFTLSRINSSEYVFTDFQQIPLRTRKNFLRYLRLLQRRNKYIKDNY